MLEEVTLRKAVEFAVATEEMGVVFYERLARRLAEDQEISAIFAQLARDEAFHRRQFQDLLKQVPEDPPVGSRDERHQMLHLLSRSEFFQGEKGLYRNLEALKTREEALLRAFQFEKATWAYYRGLADLLGEQPLLQAVIAAERSHMLKLGEYLITGGEMRGLGDSYAGGFSG